MKASKIILNLTLLLVFVSCSESKNHNIWSYEGPYSEEHWAEIDKKFDACKIGHLQSPINITTTEVKKSHRPHIQTHYKPSKSEEVNNHHTIQINLKDAGYALLPDHENELHEYKLAQFHFHTPSEEKINDKSFPLEAHFVHINKEGNIAVVALLFEVEDDDNDSLKEIFTHLLDREGRMELGEELDINNLLPSSLRYYKFSGSLTTPPCSEGVLWYVLKEQSGISYKQLSEFRKIFKMNARHTQPLNDREVEDDD